jgi:hypothetical protein
LLNFETPESLLGRVDGKVWSWVVPSAELPEVNRQHLVSGTIRRSDGVHVRAVVDGAPTPDAEQVTPNLEDAYLYLTAEGKGGAA